MESSFNRLGKANEETKYVEKKQSGGSSDMIKLVINTSTSLKFMDGL